MTPWHMQKLPEKLATIKAQNKQYRAILLAMWESLTSEHRAEYIVLNPDFVPPEAIK